jgi:predicted ATPase
VTESTVLSSEDLCTQAAAQLAAAVRRYVDSVGSRSLKQPVIEALEVRQFRNIEGAKFSLGHITVLIGENNSGKTNMLTAIACLFPRLFADRTDIFAKELGSGGMLGSASLAFVRHGYSRSNSAVGARTAEGPFFVAFENTYRDLLATWFRQSRPLAALYLRGDLLRRRWLAAPWGRIDGRRLGRRSEEAVPQDHQIGVLLQADLVGSTRVALNANPESEGKHLDQLEYEIAALRHERRLDLEELLAICGAIGVPHLSSVDITEINMEILPTPARIRAKTRRKRELESLVSILRLHRRELGTPGREALENATRELASLSGGDRNERAVTHLHVGDNFMPAKTLGSGHRRIIQIVSQVLTNDVVLIDEPEVYLHPKLLVRLLDFLVARRKSCQLVITTHSGVVIDYLYEAPDTRIFDISQTSKALPPTPKNLVDAGRAEIREVLAELGWRPSHLLQANALVWVEGPSDRVLIERFIELWSYHAIRAGRDYAVVWYGGNLLKHLIPSADSHVPSIWDVNTNNIFICDSDRKNEDDAVAANKIAMLEAVTARGGYALITHGREFENYLPRRLLDPDGALPPDMRFLDLPRQLGFERTKVQFATGIVPHLLRRDLEGSKDLANSLEEICRRLLRWSGRPGTRA